MSENNIPHVVDQGASWVYEGDPTLKPNTITFSSPGTWVMQLTADRKIIVNEDVEVSETAKVVLEAVQNLLRTQRQPLSDKVIADLKFDYIDVEMFDEGEYGTEYNIYGVEEFARAIEKLHGIE